MKSKHTIPFSNLDRDAWRRLGYLAVAVLYLFNAVFSYVKLGLYNGVGGDYFPFLSAGRVADVYGFSQMYNVENIRIVQSAQLSQLNLNLSTFEPHPSPYFPIFMAPFKYISRIDWSVSFWVWTIVTFIILVAYFYSFIKRLEQITNHRFKMHSLVFPFLVSYPVYVSFLYGQPEVFLLIFSGEFLLYSYLKKPFISGLWLGMLFIKPQALLLIMPALLLKRHWKILAGCLLSAGSIVILSTIITGLDGMIALMKLWFSYAPDTEFFSPNGMANWRMVASNLNDWTNSPYGWVIGGLGMIITLILWYKLTRKSYPPDTNGWVLNLGAIFAASLAFTWHSHIHMGMILIPFLIFLVAINQPLGKKAMDLWVFTFPIAILLSYLMSAIWNLGFEKSGMTNTISGPMLGITGLALYMLFSYKGLSLPASQDSQAAKLSKG